MHNEDYYKWYKGGELKNTEDYLHIFSNAQIKDPGYIYHLVFKDLSKRGISDLYDLSKILYKKSDFIIDLENRLRITAELKYILIKSVSASSSNPNIFAILICSLNSKRSFFCFNSRCIRFLTERISL